MKTQTITRKANNLRDLEIPKKLDAVQVEALRKEAMKIYTLAEAMAVTDKETKTGAEKLIKACTEYLTKVKNYFKDELAARAEKKRQAAAEKKELDDLIDAISDLIKDARSELDIKTNDYITAENRRIEEENRKKIFEAQKKAEEEKRKEIESLKKMGTPEAKQAVRELKAAPTVAAPVQMEEKVASYSGSIHRQLWTAQATAADIQVSLKLLVEAAAKDFDRYGKFLQPNWPSINSEARNEKEKFCVPGFMAFDKGSTAHK
jgi:hypothetical protein